uniref:Uncharacterized protein n=1 Tax=Triticum urartu TaxID=4572 RepID=A0A8R7PVU4_TRIUA
MTGLSNLVMPPRKVREMHPRARRAMIRTQKKDQDREAKKAEGEATKNGKAAVAAYVTFRCAWTMERPMICANGSTRCIFWMMVPLIPLTCSLSC